MSAPVSGRQDPDRTDLIGRHGEREVFAELIEQARSGHSGCVVLEGEPGIGKTALLAEAAAMAAGFLVLHSRAAESEFTLEYGVLSQLVLQLSESVARLEPTYRTVLAAIGGFDESTRPAVGDRFAVGAATLALLSVAAERQPILVLVDDAHWADEPTVAVLGFLARRLLAEGIVVVVARRPIDQSTPLDGVTTVQIRGLGPAEVRELLARRAASQLDDRQLEQVMALTSGNPLALTDLPIEVANNLAPRLTAHSPWPLSQRLEISYGTRVRHLSAPARLALLAAAVMEVPDGLQLHTAFTELGVAFTDLGEAEHEGLVRLDVGQVWFRHPLIRAAVIHMSTADERRRAERAAATVLAISTSTADATRRAWHLAAATIGPDDEAAEALEQAARRAETTGGFATAIHAWERAGQLSTQPDQRRSRFVAGAEAAYQAGQQQRALDLLAQAQRLPGNDVSDAEVARIHGRIEIASGRPDLAFATLVSVADRLDEPRLAVGLLFDAVFAGGFLGAPDLMLTAARRAVERCTYEDPVHQLISRLSIAAAYVFLGRSSDAMPLMDADDLLISAVGASADVLPYANAVGFCRLMMGMLPEAEVLIDSVIDSANRHGATSALPLALALRADIDYRKGAWASAVARATQSIDVSTSTGRGIDLATAHNVLAAVAAAQGRRDQCTASALACLSLSLTHRSHATEAGAHGALGLLELGTARPADALVHLGAAELTCRSNELMELAHFEWAAETVEAHTRAGTPEMAADAMATLAWHEQRSPRPIVIGLARRCAGLLAGDAEMERHFHQSIEQLTMAQQPFELARTQLCFGERLRRSKRRAEARPALEAALRTFTKLGATPWAARARAELEATGVRTAPAQGRASDSLTQQELQIATVVAAGHSNGDVASQLFLSRKTVEYHLSSIYRKLQISSRQQLADLWATEDSGT